MRWQDRDQSSNVDDRRGMRVGKGGAVLGGGGILIALIAALVFNVDITPLLQQTGIGMGTSQTEERQTTAEEDRMAKFAATILRDTEDVWVEEFQKMGRNYEKPKMVLFSGGVNSGCGFADSQVGPFYCPADEQVYLDVEFFNELIHRFGAPGEFAQAYVIAHEVGHHIQNLLGISGQVQAAQRQSDKVTANQLSVRLELQADFLAGMWARKGQEKFNFLEQGDLESALNAAQAIGDDTLQKKAQGRVVPDAFTHGTSAQRKRWFMKGFRGEKFDPNNTFQAKNL